MSDHKLMSICVLNGTLDVEESKEPSSPTTLDMNTISNNSKSTQKLINKNPI